MTAPEPIAEGQLLGQLREREVRTVGALQQLLARRPDLRGVYAPADQAADATLWSV